MGGGILLDVIIRRGEQLTHEDGRIYATALRDIYRHAKFSPKDFAFDGETPKSGDIAPNDVFRSEGLDVVAAHVGDAWRVFRQGPSGDRRVKIESIVGAIAIGVMVLSLAIGVGLLTAATLRAWESTTALTPSVHQRYDCPAPASDKPRIDMEPDHGRLDHKAARQHASV